MDNIEAIAAFDRHMGRRGLARATKAQARSHLIALAKHLVDVPLLDATRDDLLAYATAIEDVFMPRTRYSKISVAHSFYSWAQDEGHIDTIPTRRLPRPKLPQGLPRPIREDRLAKAINEAPDDVRVWLVLAAYAGLRCGEIAVLSRTQYLDTADPPLLLVHGKGDRERLVPLCDRVIVELDPCRLPPSGYMFRRRDGKPGHPTPNRLSQIMNNWLRGLGFPDTAHSLRHRFATQVQRASGDIQTTATLLGHADLSNVMIYTQFNNARAFAAVKALDEPRRPFAVA